MKPSKDNGASLNKETVYKNPNSEYTVPNIRLLHSSIFMQLEKKHYNIYVV
jgi:hypothetical protein